MKVIICGAGQVGWQIARQLSAESNDVTIVDTSPEMVRRATEELDVRGVVGFASYPDILGQAGARDADLLIAATYSDEVNMIACQVAHSVYAVPRKIARLRAQSYLDAIHTDLYRRDHLPIDVVISPEREVAEAVLQRLAAPATFDTETFMLGKAQLLGMALDADCPVLNTPLRQLDELFPSLRAIVVGVRRDTRLFVPEPQDQLFPGDQIYVFVHSEDVNRVVEVFGKSTQKQERLIILGAGNVGLGLAKAIEKRTTRIRAKVIERSRETAEFAADHLTRTIVLHGDGLDMDLLSEAGVEHADAILAVTDDDKTNILASVRAKQMGCKSAITLVNDPTLASLMNPLGIDAYINPRATTVSSILRHIRHGRVRQIYAIGDAEAEVIEAQILSTSPMAGRQIKEIDFPEGVLVGAVMKGDQVLKPISNLRLDAGDAVAIFAMSKDVREVERLLQVSIDFF